MFWCLQAWDAYEQLPRSTPRNPATHGSFCWRALEALARHLASHVLVAYCIRRRFCRWYLSVPFGSFCQWYIDTSFCNLPQKQCEWAWKPKVRKGERCSVDCLRTTLGECQPFRLSVFFIFQSECHMCNVFCQDQMLFLATVSILSISASVRGVVCNLWELPAVYCMLMWYASLLVESKLSTT